MAQANYTGNVLERFIQARLMDRGYTQVRPNRFLASRILNQPIFARRFHVGQSIYGTEHFCDFICFHPQRWPDNLIIESKWQQSAGSVDEKYPYLVLNIEGQYQYPTIVLLDGGGYKPGAEAWMRRQVGQGNFRHVFNMVQFSAWANNGNL